MNTLNHDSQITVVAVRQNDKEWYAPIVDGRRSSSVAETIDMAFLIGIGEKYDGRNSQFAKMAARMLNIETAWSE